MSVTRTFNIEVTITVDDENADLLDKYERLVASGSVAKSASYVGSLHYHVWKRAGNANVPKGMSIDHINNDAGDHRRENLSVATHSEQVRKKGKSSISSSRYWGVTWDKRLGTWRSTVSKTAPNGKTNRKTGKVIKTGAKYLAGTAPKGRSELDAAIWYDQKVRELGLQDEKPLNFTDQELELLVRTQGSAASISLAAG